jgi:hypothetical protein
MHHQTQLLFELSQPPYTTIIPSFRRRPESGGSI